MEATNLFEQVLDQRSDSFHLNKTVKNKRILI